MNWKFILLLIGLFIILFLCWTISEDFLDTKLGKGYGLHLDEPKNDPEIEYTLTLGNWGKKEPDFCYETSPRYDKELKMKTCHACLLQCSSKNAQTRCERCFKQL